MHKLWIVISLVVVASGCIDSEVNKDKIVVLGHAGAGFPSFNNHYPTNSLESIAQALLVQGADGVEVDVQMTADSQFVLYHDNRLESGTNDTGFVLQRSWSELKHLKRRDGETALFKSASLIRLTDLLDFIDSLDLDVYLSLNLKHQYEAIDPQSYNKTLAHELGFILREYPNRAKVIIESRDIDFLKYMQVSAEVLGVKMYFVGVITEANLSEAGPYVSGFVTNYLNETQTSVRRAQDQGFEIAVHGVKIRQDIVPAINFQPDFIQTDNIPLTLSYLER